MVGLVIGMIAMIVMMQVFAVFEGQKRTNTGGNDAQTNGAIALYMVERDTRMAGWGLSAANFGNCNVTYSYCDGRAGCGGGAAGPIAGLSFASLIITDGGPNPDSITVQYFSNPNLGSFQYPGSTMLSNTMPQSSSELDVATVKGCAANSIVLVSQGGNCTLMGITLVKGAVLKIQHNTDTSLGGSFNPPNTNGWPGYSQGASVACMAPPSNGPIFQRTFSIDTTARQLRRSDNTVTPVITNEAVMPEIFDLQAQYGIANAGGSQVVNAWVDATGGTWANPTQVNRNRIKAVRIALVARSSQYQKPDPGTTCATTSAPVTTPAMVAAWVAWPTSPLPSPSTPPFSTANYPADWQCYRYKVFETVVPLRNVLWGNI
jgi:type IV pilus assembly protein PilW